MKIYLIMAATLGAIAGYLFFLTVPDVSSADAAIFADRPAGWRRFFDVGALIAGVAGAVCGAVVSVTFCLIAGITWRPRKGVA